MKLFKINGLHKKESWHRPIELKHTVDEYIEREGTKSGHKHNQQPFAKQTIQTTHKTQEGVRNK